MKRIMIMAGGTGGHVMPALAVAEYLRECGCLVLWVGVRNGIEADVVTRAGFPFKSIHIKGLRNSGLLRKAIMPFMLPWALLQMLWVIWRNKPQSILGMGGFTSAPGGIAAAVLGRHLVIHEQNTIVGLTNRYLAQFANRILSGFPQADGFTNYAWVGNPVRREILDIPPPQERMAVRTGPMRILIVGGSLGAQVFNDHLPKLLASQHNTTIEVWHQCGRGSAEHIAERYLAAGIGCQVNNFIDNMAEAYEWCDVIICRAGAMTVSEVCVVGIVAFFVPYPHATNDHQTHNAAYLHARDAAYLVPQDEFLKGDWLESLSMLALDRSRLLAMAMLARQLAKRQAVQKVANIFLDANSP